LVFRYVDTPYRVTGKNPPDKNPPGKNPPEKIHLNAVERKPVETRDLNPNASEASYKPEQRSYRKTKRKNINFFWGDFVGGILSWNLIIYIANNKHIASHDIHVYSHNIFFHLITKI